MSISLRDIASFSSLFRLGNNFGKCGGDGGMGTTPPQRVIEFSHKTNITNIELLAPNVDNQKQNPPLTHAGKSIIDHLGHFCSV